MIIDYIKLPKEFLAASNIVEEAFKKRIYYLSMSEFKLLAASDSFIPAATYIDSKHLPVDREVGIDGSTSRRIAVNLEP